MCAKFCLFFLEFKNDLLERFCQVILYYIICVGNLIEAKKGPILSYKRGIEFRFESGSNELESDLKAIQMDHFGGKIIVELEKLGLFI